MILYDKIQDFEKSEKHKQFITGQRYYDSDNIEIMNRKFETAYTNENSFNVKLYENVWKANNKIASSWYKFVVDQKVHYLLGNEPTVKTENEDNRVDLFYGKQFHTNLMDASTGSSIKGLCWGHPYVENNKLKIKTVEPDNIIGNFDDDKNLIELYKFWLKGKEEKNPKTIYTYYVEEWTDKDVTLYEITSEGKETARYTRGHIDRKTVYKNAKVVLESINSWGKIPFIPMFNTKDCKYDLKPIKSCIDAYDVVSSDFANNLEDFQDPFYVIKNYGGTNPSAVVQEIKRNKAVMVDGDGGVESQHYEVPYQAREKFLEIARKDIIKFSMALDTESLSGTALITSAIRAKYLDLDTKACKFANQVQKYIDEYGYFVNRFIEIKNLGVPLDVEVTFNKNIIINETELLDANANQIGNVSKETQLEKHPWINNVADELEKIDEENKGITIP